MLGVDGATGAVAPGAKFRGAQNFRRKIKKSIMNK